MGIGSYVTKVPLAIPNDLLWLNASDSASITQSGSAVSLWKDATGKGSNVSQGTGSAQPLYVASGISGYPAINFDGSGDLLQTTTTSPLVDNLFSGGGFVFAVVSIETAGGNSAGRLFSQSGGNLFCYFVPGDTGYLKPSLDMSFSTTPGSWSASSGTALALNTPAIVGFSYNSSSVSNDPSIYVNSLTPIAITETSTPVGTSSTATTITIGNSSVGTRTLDGSIAEIIFGKNLTAGTLQDVMFYFANRYGIALL